MPPPRLTCSLALYEKTGFTFTVSTLDSTPWNRPIQSESYFVASPNGTVIPTPKFHSGVTSVAKNALGTNLFWLASPPDPVLAGLLRAAGTLAPLLKVVEGAI